MTELEELFRTSAKDTQEGVSRWAGDLLQASERLQVERGPNAASALTDAAKHSRESAEDQLARLEALVSEALTRLREEVTR